MKEGWEYKKLGEVCNIDFGTRVVRSRDAGSIYPVYGGGGATFKMDTYNREDCMVISRFGMSEQCTRFVKGRFFLNDSGLTLSMKKHCMIQNYMDWQILYLNNTIYSLGRGAAQKNLDTKALAEIIIAYPDNLSEQQSIVDYLDSAFAKIDSMKANAEKALNEAKALFQASLKKMLEPKDGWEEKTLGEIADFVRGPFGGSLTKSMFKNTGYAVYEQQHAIHKHINIRYYIDFDKFKEMERFSVKAGDIIMSCSGVTLGKVNILPHNAPAGIINQALLKMRVKKNIDVHYFTNWLESEYFQKTIQVYSGGAAIPNVPSVKILKDIDIKIPPLSEQQFIVITLDSLKSKVGRLQENYNKISQECDALKQAILRQVFE